MVDSNIQSDQFYINIKPLNTVSFELLVTGRSLISEVQDQISAKTSIPSERQRLLYKGRRLKPVHSLSFYHISANAQLYLVASFASSVLELVHSAIEDTHPSGRRQFTIDDRKEAIYQNALTIEMLFDSFNSENAFDNTKRYFSVGMWVDVKDTVNQWLEAQILDIEQRPDGNYLYVHYNSWPDIWNEWIEASSNRIQPLRTYTLQAIDAPVQSPVPNQPCDSQRPHSYDLDLLSGINILARLENTISGNFRNLSEDEAQVAPLLDRTGRLITDIAAVLAKTAQTPVHVVSTDIQNSYQDVGIHVHAVFQHDTQHNLNTQDRRLRGRYSI